MLCISNSWLRFKPSRVDAPVYVTKSPLKAPCAVSATVTVALPDAVVKGLVKLAVSLIGVIS